MAVKFNPFTGQLQIDEKGSGGGGAQYLDGEVATYNDLPLDGTAAADSAWLVRSASGTWLIGRKPAGIYIRTATAGVSRDADYTYAGIFPDVFSDANFTLYDDGDATKTAQFQLSGITAGQNRTLTVPDASGTIARTEDFAAPPAIGSTTPNTGTFTTIRIGSTSTFEAGIGKPNLGVMGFNRQDAPTTYHFAHGFDGTTRAAFCSSVAFFGWASGNATSVSGCDVRLWRDAAGTLAQYNGTNPQTFRLYNTFTDASNYERGFMRWSSNVLQIGTEKAGTGSARALEFQTDGTTRVTIDTSGQFGVGVAPERPFHIRGSSAFMRLDRQGTFGPAMLFTRMASGTTVTSSWLFGPTDQVAGVSNDDFAIIDFGTSVSGAGGTQRLTISKSTGQLTVNGNLNLSTKDLVTDTTTGTKIATGTTQKLGFWNATPAVQPAAIADATDAASTQDRLNDLLATMRTLGLIAT